MKLFEGKSPSEKNKIIAALALGAMAVLAIGYNIIGLYPSHKTTTVNITASPTPTASPRTNLETVAMPSREEEISEYATTPVVYDQRAFYTPDAGRNIFAFYEPPPPTPYSPTPFQTPKATPIITPPPTPVPPILVGFVTPESVYAGSKTFRLEVNGDKFTPDSVILFNGSQLPTTFISPQKLVANVDANMISGEGPKQIMVVSPTNPKLYSNQVLLNAQAPPKPQLQYIGAKLAQRGNNNTAYFREQGKNTEFGARLNDTVGGRFKVMSISKEEVILEDASLGFRYKLALYRPTLGQTASSDTPILTSPGIDPNRINKQYNPNPSIYVVPSNGEIPGIPGSVIQRNVPQPPPPSPNKEDDEDDNNR